MEIKHKALNLLLSKDPKGVINFEHLLEENVKNVCVLLQIDTEDVTKLLPELHYNSFSCENIQWKFVCLCFHILFLPDENSEILNVTYLTNVKKCFQFIVSLGLLPNLIPGVGIDMKLRFKNFDILPTEKMDIKDKYYRLKSITNIMLKCLESDNLRRFLIENHMNDILASLLQITAAPLKKPDNENLSEQFYLELLQDRKYFQTKLHDLILNIHQPLIFRELMFLNGNKKSPTWLKNNVLQILMERIQNKNGVESLIRALFDSETQDIGVSWKHWDILTKLLMTKPNYINDNEYYKNICGQLITLLNKRSFDGKRITIFENATILSAKYLFEIKEELCINNFLNPLVKVLLKFTENSNNNKNDVITDEIEQNIFILCSIFIENKTNDKIIPIEIIKPISKVLFHLFSATFNTKTKLNEEIANILSKYLSNCDDKKLLYEYFLFNTTIKDIPSIKNGCFIVENGDIYFKTTNIESDLFTNSNICINLLENCKNDVITSSFFTYLLEMFLNTYNSTDISLDLTERKIVIYQLLLKLLENKIVLQNLKKNPSELLIFSENFLKLMTDKNMHKETDFDSENFQILFIIIMIISNVIKNCENKNIINEHSILINILKKISIETSNNELKILINEINNLNNATEKEKSQYEIAIDEICSPFIPEQAHGLATIVKLIEQKDPETYRRKQYVLNIFQQNLKSEESFIYLRAIAGLAALTDAFPNIILETLTDEYLYPKGATEKDIETRMKLGEVLIRVTSKLGDSVVKYKSLLLNTFLSAAKDIDPLIRASSLSNLGEVCKVLGFRLGTIITEILFCIHDVISHDRAVEVRRAAVSVIRQLFIGLGKEMIAFLKEDILPIYRTLKSLYNEDPDAVTRLQAQLALEELNEIMKSLIAPESTAEKNFVIP